MSGRLRDEFIRLLEEDKEFRYTVAGYLGLSEILRRLDRLEENQTRLWEEVKGLREGQERLWDSHTKLWEEVKSLREGQEKLWEEVKSLHVGQEKLWEEVKSLREGQEKLWDSHTKLWEEVRGLKLAVVGLERGVGELARQVGALSDVVGFGLEDIAKVVVPGWLYRHEGIEVGELGRRFFRVDGEEVEANLYGEGFRDGKKVVVIGEAKARIYRREVEEFVMVLEKVEKLVADEVYRFMFGYLIHPSAEEEGKKRGITLIASYMR